VRNQNKILLGAIIIVLLLFALWLMLGRAGRNDVSVAFTTARGHFGGVYSPELVVEWVTNSYPSQITLEEPKVQFENSVGHFVLDQGSSWNQEGYYMDVPPGKAAWLANGFGPDRKRLRFSFEFHRSGGPVLGLMSKAIRVLPLRRLPPRQYEWLRRNGLIDGLMHGSYESAWFANPNSP
jgi:hypothetical protein